MACRSGQEDMVHMLLNAGASVNALTKVHRLFCVADFVVADQLWCIACYSGQNVSWCKDKS